MERIRQAAARDRRQRFTALWHHACAVEGLSAAYWGLRPQASPGVDGQTWAEYGEDLEANLADLSDRLCRGAYRAKPVRRAYIPKADGRQRPIGVPVLEDKIVQRAVVAVLGAIYEVDFRGFSYGFRPGRGAHNALDAVVVGMRECRVNWVLDADIRGFFDAIDHEWLLKFLEHRIADRRVLRQVCKWLAAGVLEDGAWRQEEYGTPQGGSISPLLANVYLHYAFDLWADHWRRTAAAGGVMVVRYADDFVVGFEHRADAEGFLGELTERFRKFHLELKAEKTRLLEFGRYAAERRAERGQGKPETFDFLGFTHICGRTRKNGRFMVLRRPMRTRVRAKLLEIHQELRTRMHRPVRETGKWLKTVLEGWYRYYAVPTTWRVLRAFYSRLGWLWRRVLNRRSQRGPVAWQTMYRLIDHWLPPPRILHPYPWERLHVTTRGKSPVR